MANPIVLLAGQHMNEKSALYLAPRVAKALQEKGHQVELLENPDRRTLLEIVTDAYKSGQTLTKEYLEQWWSGWQDSILNLNEPWKFALHNYGLNATIFEPMSEIQEIIRSMEKQLTRFSQFRPLVGRRHAGSINIGGGKIEIPEYRFETLPEDVLKIVKQLPDQETLGRFETYLLETDIDRTRAAGLLDDEMVEVLAIGIAYMVTSGWKEEETYLAPRVIW